MDRTQNLGRTAVEIRLRPRSWPGSPGRHPVFPTEANQVRLVFDILDTKFALGAMIRGKWTSHRLASGMSEPDILRGYAVDAAELIPMFEIIRTEEFLAPVAAMLPDEPSRILEIGAGTGRDAAWLVEQGHEVLAVEPVDELREAGMALHPSERIEWVNDRLPALHGLADASGYDLVLVLSVWQHLLPDVHRRAVETLAGKLAHGGRLIMSLRHGPGSPSRPCYPADPERIIGYAEDAGLRLLLRRAAGSIQKINRDRGVTWTWLCFERPADQDRRA